MAYEDYCVTATAAPNDEGEPQVRAFAATTKDLVDEARRIHGQGPTVTAALGRLLTAGVMMGDMLKNDTDLLTMQIRGTGPVKSLVVTADNAGNVKGYAGVPTAEAPVINPGHFNVAGCIGQGTLTVIKDMGLKEPYAGTVDLRTGEIAEDLAWYFASSEQVPSAVSLGVLIDKDNTVRSAGGFIIQMMPFAEKEIIDKLEDNLVHLAHVTTLLSNGDTPEQMLQQAFAGIEVDITGRKPVQYHCNCSRERVERVLLSIGEKDLKSLIDEGKDIELACQFCGKKYTFDFQTAASVLKHRLPHSAKPHPRILPQRGISIDPAHVCAEAEEGMRDGFIKVAAVTPEIKVAEPEYNTDSMIKSFDAAVGNGAKIIVFPELSITGYTCADLFLQEVLLRKASEQLLRFAAHTKGTDVLSFVGLPLRIRGELYNVAAAVQDGKILAFIPKRFIPNYSEFYEERWFMSGEMADEEIDFDGRRIPFGSRILFDVDAVSGLSVAAEICEDLWIADSPDIEHSMAGATLIVNLSASDEVIGKGQYRKMLVTGVSAKTVSAYIYADAGEGESSTDLVFGAQNLIAENGLLLAEGKLFEPGITYAEIDIQHLIHDRQRMNTFDAHAVREGYLHIPVSMKREETDLSDRFIDPHPFVPADKKRRHERCEEIFEIQSRGLSKRLQHIGTKTAVIGVSGGLDSTLALLVTARAYDLLGLDHANIQAVTMPAFGTTDRTKGNACLMAEALGTTLKEIPVGEAVNLHFRDIGHDPEVRDVTYENCQARERTQVLMDIANQEGGIVVGTGDMSEMALGWCTYNGDHMSMYAVNVGVPKTLVRHLVQYCADETEDETLRRTLLDVLATPVSPELLPPTGNGEIAQKTEDLVGPYELHDFFLYHCLRWGSEPVKILRLAEAAFDGRNASDGGEDDYSTRVGTYDEAVITKWLRQFYRRFFQQQFKRSCMPDGPKVGSVALSPRGDLRMPSDACVKAWLEELQER